MFLLNSTAGAPAGFDVLPINTSFFVRARYSSTTSGTRRTALVLANDFDGGGGGGGAGTVGNFFLFISPGEDGTGIGIADSFGTLSTLCAPAPRSGLGRKLSASVRCSCALAGVEGGFC